MLDGLVASLLDVNVSGPNRNGDDVAVSEAGGEDRRVFKLIRRSNDLLPLRGSGMFSEKD